MIGTLTGGDGCPVSAFEELFRTFACGSVDLIPGSVTPGTVGGVSVEAPTPIRRAMELIRLDLRPLRPLPSLGRIALAGLLSALASVVACVIISEAGKALLSPPASFDKFNPPGYIVLTVLGVAAATVGWAILVRMTSQPRWCLKVAAVIVTIVLLLPDVAILPHDPTGAVIVLMIEHVVIAVITTWLLLRVSPPGTRPASERRAARSDVARVS